MKKLTLVFLSLCCAVLLSACSKKKETVVVYTAIDQVYAEVIFAQFEEETGITVLAVYDTEANKTTGLVNRIIAEADEPVCDVFWNNEFTQTIDLEQQGLLQSYESPSADTIPDYYKSSTNQWTAVGGRARVFLVNNDLVAAEDMPTSIFDLFTDELSGNVAFAYPMFGTTRTFAAALYAELGAEDGYNFFYLLDEFFDAQVVDGNSVTKDLAASGAVAVALTDSDDAKLAIADGANVTMIYPDQEDSEMGTLMTPSTVAMISGAPNEENAQILIDYLLSEEVERALVDAEFYDISIRDADTEDSIKGMDLSLEDIYAFLEISTAELEVLFATAD